MTRLLRSVALGAVLCLGAAAQPLEAQTASLDCGEGECYVVPWARGHGGLVGRAEAGNVEAILVCQGTNQTKVVERGLLPDGGGLVTLLFGIDDGSHDALACAPDEDATLTIRGLAEGGWYWIHDEANSAVAPLLPRDVLENRRVIPVNPGSRDILIESNAAGTASFVKQLSTGRVGLLSHVQPEPEREDVPCGPVADGELADGSPRYVTRETDCEMGDGGTFIGLHTYGAAGFRVPVRNLTLVRPGSGVLRVGLSLWLNRTGSVVHGDADDFPPTFGWPAIEDARSLRTEWEIELLGGPDATPESAGVDVSDLGDPDENGDAPIHVSPSEEYCPAEGERHSARFRVRAAITSDNSGTPYNPVRPRIRHSDELGGAAAEIIFDVVCPQPEGSAANAGPTMGRELAFQSGVDRR